MSNFLQNVLKNCSKSSTDQLYRDNVHRIKLEYHTPGGRTLMYTVFVCKPIKELAIVQTVISLNSRGAVFFNIVGTQTLQGYILIDNEKNFNQSVSLMVKFQLIFVFICHEVGCVRFLKEDHIVAPLCKYVCDLFHFGDLNIHITGKKDFNF